MSNATFLPHAPRAQKRSRLQRRLATLYGLGRRYWLALVFMLLIGAGAVATPAWAAPLPQGRTVPTATPTSVGEAEPTATLQPTARPTSRATATPTGTPFSGANSGGAAGSLPGGGVRIAPMATATVNGSCVEDSATTLTMMVSVGAVAVRPGQLVELHFVITNEGTAKACSVQLRNELPPSLEYVSLEALQATATQSRDGNRGASVVSALWPAVAPGGQVSAHLTLKVTAQASAGQVVDNLAAVRASNAPEIGVGVSLGLPPIMPPDFRD